MKENMGNPPGKVTVPSSTKGTPANAPMDGNKKFGDPSREGTGMPGAKVGIDTGGDAPGAVSVASATQGNHPANHTGKPGDAKQGHHKYGG